MYNTLNNILIQGEKSINAINLAKTLLKSWFFSHFQGHWRPMISNLKNEKNRGGKYSKEAMFKYLSKSDNLKYLFYIHFKIFTIHFFQTLLLYIYNEYYFQVKTCPLFWGDAYQICVDINAKTKVSYSTININT